MLKQPKINSVLSYILVILYAIGLFLALTQQLSYFLPASSNFTEKVSYLYAQIPDSLIGFFYSLPGLNLFFVPLTSEANSWFLSILPPSVCTIIICILLFRIILQLKLKQIIWFAISIFVFVGTQFVWLPYLALIGLAQRKENIIFDFTPQIFTLNLLSYAFTFAFVGFWVWLVKKDFRKKS